MRHGPNRSPGRKAAQISIHWEAWDMAYGPWPQNSLAPGFGSDEKGKSLFYVAMQATGEGCSLQAVVDVLRLGRQPYSPEDSGVTTFFFLGG